MAWSKLGTEIGWSKLGTKMGWSKLGTKIGCPEYGITYSSSVCIFSICLSVCVSRFLIENGARVDIVNNDGELPIDIADTDEMENLLQTEIYKQGSCERWLGRLSAWLIILI
jgi:hypothetical protein